MAPEQQVPSEGSGGVLDRIAGGWSLRGRRVRLRLLSEADLPERLRMTNDPDVQMETLGQTVGERTPYDIRSWFRALARDPHSRQIAIEDESGRYVGDIDLHSVDAARGEAWIEPLVGSPELRASGPENVADCLRDAVGTLVEFLFREAGMRRIMAEILSTNPVGLKVFSELGFTESGQIDHMNGVFSHVLELAPERFCSPAAGQVTPES